MSWVTEELEGVDLGDQRRNRRLVKIIEDLASAPNASVPQASRDAAAMQGIYDFWANRRIEPDAILGGHQRQTVKRMEEQRVVLAIQDTSELDYRTQKHLEDVGPISNPEAQGLKLHTVLAASGSGVPLGVLHQKVWVRAKGRRSAAKRKEIAEKESIRWLESLEATQSQIPTDISVITIGDREADIYELFVYPRRAGSEFLIRAAQNRNSKQHRCGTEVEPLFAAIAKAPVVGARTIELQRTPRRAARAAHLRLRYVQLWLQPPLDLVGAEAIEVSVILAEEETPPEGESGIRWLLLTTLPITTVEGAQQCLDWYACRWLIERYHYTLKSGCRLEHLQLESGERLHRALSCYAIVAWRLLWLTYQARVDREQSVEGILEPSHWQALYCMVHQTPVPPEIPPSLRECVRWMAQLGGYLGRRWDGEPGICTLWRGQMRLHDMAATWELLHRQQE